MINFTPYDITRDIVKGLGNQKYSYFYPVEVEYEMRHGTTITPLNFFLVQYEIYVVPVLPAHASANSYPDTLPNDNYYYIDGVTIGINANLNTYHELTFVGNPANKQGIVELQCQDSRIPNRFKLRHQFILTANSGPDPINGILENRDRLLKDHANSIDILNNNQTSSDLYGTNNSSGGKRIGYIVYLSDKGNGDVQKLYFYETSVDANFYADNNGTVKSSPLVKNPTTPRVQESNGFSYTLKYNKSNQIFFEVDSSPTNGNPLSNGCQLTNDSNVGLYTILIKETDVEESVDLFDGVKARAAGWRGNFGDYLGDTQTKYGSIHGIPNQGTFTRIQGLSTIAGGGWYIYIDGSTLEPGETYRLVCVVYTYNNPGFCWDTPNSFDANNISHSFISEPLTVEIDIDEQENFCLLKNGFKGLKGTFGPSIKTCPLDKLTSIVSLDFTNFENNTTFTQSFKDALSKVVFRIKSVNDSDNSDYDLLFQRIANNPLSSGGGVFSTFSEVNNVVSATQTFDILESPNIPNIGTLINDSTLAPAKSNQDWRGRVLICEWLFYLDVSIPEFGITQNNILIARQTIRVDNEPEALMTTNLTPDNSTFCEEDNLVLDFCTEYSVATTPFTGMNMLNRVVFHVEPFYSNQDTAGFDSVMGENSSHIDRDVDYFSATNEACGVVRASEFLRDKDLDEGLNRLYHQALGSGYAANFEGSEKGFISFPHDEQKFEGHSEGNDIAISAWIYLKSLPPSNQYRYIFYKGSDNTNILHNGFDLDGVNSLQLSVGLRPEVFLRVTNYSGNIRIDGGWKHAVPFVLFNPAFNTRDLQWSTNSATPINTGEWIHILWVKPAFSYTVAEQKVYINGVLAPLNAVIQTTTPGQHHWDYICADDGTPYSLSGGNAIRSTEPGDGTKMNGFASIGRRIICSGIPDSSVVTEDSLDAFVKEVRFQKGFYTDAQALAYFNEGLGALGSNHCTDLIWFRANERENNVACDRSMIRPVNGTISINGDNDYVAGSLVVPDCNNIATTTYGVPLGKFNVNSGFWVEV